MKIVEFQMIIMKIIKFYDSIRNHEDHEHHRIPKENHKDNENHKIQIENHENHKNH